MIAPRLVGVVAALTCFASCGGESAPPACTPGASASCACPDGRTGAQVCGGDGAYGPCVCESATPAATPAVSAPAPMAPTPVAPAPAAPTPAPAGGRCGPRVGPQTHAPAAHVRAALQVAAPELATACAEYDHTTSAAQLTAAFEGCMTRQADAVGSFEACAPDGDCCEFGVSSLVGPPGDGQGSWIIFRGPGGIDDYLDHVYWLPPDGSRVAPTCTWAPYNYECYGDDDLTSFEGCDMPPAQWMEIGLTVRRFLCNPPT
ncbi:MAG: hypothetical protein H6719_04500 [Sandaracinaceae bacterium]|nr:hypothetical protein [Sandaracinaceae bacterium]